MRPLVLPAAGGVAVVLVATLGILLASHGPEPSVVWYQGKPAAHDPAPTQNFAAGRTAPKLKVAPIRSTAGGSVGPVVGGSSGMTTAYSLLNRSTGAVVGSANMSSFRNTTESMIKPWIAADYLRTQAAAGKTPSSTVLNEIKLMIIDSNDDMAEKYYRANGRTSVTNRLVSICKLSNVKIVPYWWALTEMSARDGIRYGQCLADGRAAGPKWTQWLLTTMTQVRGGVKDQISTTKQGGRWGIIDGLPASVASATSIKNGWTPHDDGWHINCLAVHAQFILVVEMRHPSSLQAGADYCAKVARQVVTPLLG